ncbi:MAG: hypothetical protein PF503_05550 [Desulfobacula sp.]|nr:hypothetical protein [Desulfobacula sp.]
METWVCGSLTPWSSPGAFFFLETPNYGLQTPQGTHPAVIASCRPGKYLCAIIAIKIPAPGSMKVHTFNVPPDQLAC